MFETEIQWNKLKNWNKKPKITEIAGLGGGHIADVTEREWL